PAVQHALKEWFTDIDLSLGPLEPEQAVVIGAAYEKDYQAANPARPPFDIMARFDSGQEVQVFRAYDPVWDWWTVYAQHPINRDVPVRVPHGARSCELVYRSPEGTEELHPTAYAETHCYRGELVPRILVRELEPVRVLVYPNAIVKLLAGNR